MEIDTLSPDSVCATRTRGRPRAFDPDEALAAALRVFWSRGYEGASLTELTGAMGITRPSLYACFGNKEALFRAALDLYEREKLAYMQAALDAPTALAVAERFLNGALAIQTSRCDPKGCLGVVASVACTPQAECIRDAVIARLAHGHDLLVARLERAKCAGDLPPHVDPAGLAHHLKAVLQGMAVQASSGASQADLQALVATTLALWPRGG